MHRSSRSQADDVSQISAVVTGRVLPSGEHAVLVEVDSLAEVLALRRLLWVDGRTSGVVDAVTGAEHLPALRAVFPGF